MKKVILGFVLLIIITIAGSVYYVLTNLDSLVESAIEKYGSEATQTAVLVDAVKINLADGAGGITGLTVANPGDFTMPHAFSLGVVRVAIDLQSLQQEPYIINEITVLTPEVFVEINENNKTNLNELKKNLVPNPATTSQQDKTQVPAEGSAKQPRLIIRRVTFADGSIQARVAALQNKEYKLKLPGLDMTNLGGTKGATATQLASEILKRLTDRATEVVKNSVIDVELKKLKQKAQQKLDAEKAKLQEKVDTKVDEQTDKVKDKLKGLFLY
ncbi:MAG: hypothetical protein RQ982_01470 [Gammaproteobacteria bacterium]|nr:hypothetical protein [Gammaproteobacteria bacterium]